MAVIGDCHLQGLSESTVLNLCGAMVEEGLLRRGNGGYQLGNRIAELGNAYLKSVTEVEEFYELCRDFYHTAPHTVQLGVLGDGMTVVYLARHDGRDPLNLGLASEIGRSVPACCTANGKALLAALSEEELDNRLPPHGSLEPLTSQSLTSADELLDELHKICKSKYAEERGDRGRIALFGHCRPHATT